MTQVMKHFSFFMIMGLFSNPIMSIAAEYRNLPVPSLYGAPVGIITTGRTFGIEKMYLFPNYQKQILILSTVIVIVSVMYYMYKHNTIKRIKDATFDELHSCIDSLQKRIEDCINKLPFSNFVKLHLKQSISKSIAEYIANIPNAIIRYIQKNKRYLISITAIPVGVFLGYPVTGSLIAAGGVLYGFLQSLDQEVKEFRIEMANFRLETSKSFVETNKNIKEGFENSNQNAEKNKKEVLDKLEQETGKLSDQIQGLAIQINELQNNVSGKIDNLDNKVEILFERLEDVINQLRLLPNQINIKNIEELEKIKELLGQIDGTQITQADKLNNIQDNLEVLLNKNEINEKKIIELLDKVVGGQLLLTEVKDKCNKQENILKNTQNIIEEIHNKIEKNQQELIKFSHQSIEQCSDLVSKISILEITVKKNEELTLNKFNRIDEKISNNHEVLCQLLSQRCNDLETKLTFKEEENKEREKKKDELIAVLFNRINIMEEEQKRANGLLDQLIEKVTNTDQNVEQLVKFTKKYDKDKLTYKLNQRTHKNKKKPILLNNDLLSNDLLSLVYKPVPLGQQLNLM